MAFERIRQLRQRFSPPTREQKIASLQETVDELSSQRDKIYEDTSAIEQQEAKLLEQGKTNKSKIVRKRLASQLIQLRRDLQRRHTTAAMINGQVDILSTDIHNRTLLQQEAMANLGYSDKLTENAVKAEEILETLSSDVALASTLEPCEELASQEELDILKEFDEPEDEPEKEPEDDGQPTSREDGCISYPEARSHEHA